MAEFQNLVECLLSDGIDILTFPLGKISNGLLSSAPICKQPGNSTALLSWGNAVQAAFNIPSESHHHLISDQRLTVAVVD
jgi:hypothetical protein